MVNARAVGIDIGSRIQVAAVQPELNDDPVQTFQSFTADIERMADLAGFVGDHNRGDGVTGRVLDSGVRDSGGLRLGCRAGQRPATARPCRGIAA